MKGKKKDLVQSSLLRLENDYFPIFTSMTPQFLKRATENIRGDDLVDKGWRYQVSLDLDVIQVGHPSFYPVKILDFPEGTKYKDDFGRTHVITSYYDEFCAPFPLSRTSSLDIQEISSKWDSFEFPDPFDEKWYYSTKRIIKLNELIRDPPSVWGVINGPLEPTWQLISDGWPEFFILARRDKKLAKSIINRVTDYCISAGKGMIEHSVDVIRIGDDYGLNEGLMVNPETWHDIIFPCHAKLVRELKKAARKNVPIILHSDGDITSILKWLVASGIDALNPIQPDALDFETVVKQIGKRLALTGAFDLRLFLKEDCMDARNAIMAEVKRLIRIIREFNEENEGKTGFCIGPSHQVQPNSNVSLFEFWVQAVQKERNV
ncbi:MAG: uroporphyrinogen decarboxylase family protein [Promethearchaeota archaeon]